MSLANKTLIGFVWKTIQSGFSALIGGATTIILAFLLLPEDFGLVALLAVFIALGTALTEAGFKDAIIRSPQLSGRLINTAFTVNVAISVAIYSFLFFIAPVIAGFYSEPILTSLVRVVSFSVILSSFQVVCLALLSRAMDFKTQMLLFLPALVISSAIAIFFAYLGFGVWALVSQILIIQLIYSISLWLNKKERLKLELDKESLETLFSYSSSLIINRMLTILFENAYLIVIGKFFSPNALGLYFFAHKLKGLVLGQVIGNIQAVTFPALSKSQDDRVLLKRNARKVFRLTILTSYFILLVTIAIAEPVFSLLLPERWAGSVVFLQIFCIILFAHPILYLHQNIMKIVGETYLYLKISILNKVLISISIFLTYELGIIMMMIGQLVVSFLMVIPCGLASNRLVSYKLTEQISDFWKICIVSVFTGAAWYALALNVKFGNDINTLIFNVVLIPVIYISGVFLAERDLLIRLISYAKKFKSKVPNSKCN